MSQPHVPDPNWTPPPGQAGWPSPGPHGSFGPGPHGPRGAPKKKPNIILIIVLVVIGGGFLLMTVLGVFAWLGMRRYLDQSKSAEARMNVGILARGVASCAEVSGMNQLADANAPAPGLPPTSPKVPASLGQVRGVKYSSQPADWSAPAFKCAGFDISVPQYFQYEWVLSGPGQKGMARAEADLDGDGTADMTFEQDVECSGPADDLNCKVSALREKR
jgi:hypothetical protein